MGQERSQWGEERSRWTGPKAGPNDYTVGSILEYTTFTGETRRVIVECRYEDIKNGKPGFDSRLASDPSKTYWGYDHQINRVVKF